MRKRLRKAFTLVELVTAMIMVSIVILTLGSLLVNGQRVFQSAYDSIHKSIHEDSRALVAAFGKFARQSNRSNYTLYEKDGELFTPANPEGSSDVAKGQAIEFRYWDTPFHEINDKDILLETTNIGSHYALFYLEDDQIKVDFGEVVEGVGGVSEGGIRKTTHITTRLLADNVDIDTNNEIFSHSVTGGGSGRAGVGNRADGMGNGCVNLNVTLRDDDDEVVEVVTAILLRADWPR